jgi:Cof subfamily protein (haloacid dehalogenase superfamily)
MEKKLIVFDIDGTIISYHGKTHIPPETVEAIKLLKEKGHLIALATARSFLMAKPVMDLLCVSSAVLHNGAMGMMNKECLFEKRIDKKTSMTIIGALEKTPLCVFAFDGENIYVSHTTENSETYIRNETGMNDIIKPLCNCTNSLLSINLYGEDEQIIEFINGIDSVTYHRNQCEITANDVSKSDGIKRLAEAMSITQQNIIAVGDGINDIDMIRAAEIGIAVGGAHCELKDAADMVADDIDAGGILKIFKQLKLI